jgi:hypothetical protein
MRSRSQIRGDLARGIFRGAFIPQPDPIRVDDVRLAVISNLLDRRHTWSLSGPKRTVTSCAYRKLSCNCPKERLLPVRRPRVDPPSFLGTLRPRLVNLTGAFLLGRRLVHLRGAVKRGPAFSLPHAAVPGPIGLLCLRRPLRPAAARHAGRSCA